MFASNKLVSLIAATMLLLLVDSAIHDSPARPFIGRTEQGKFGTTNAGSATATQQTQCYPSNLECQNQKLDALEKLAGIKNDPQMSALTLENHQQRLHQLETIAGIIPEREEALDNPDKYEIKVNHYIRLEALERAFANNPPATQQTSVTQDITSTGNSATQTPYPMAVCNALVNGQNLCTEQTVTAVVGALAVGLIAGIVAIVQTEINNKQNTDKQRENSNNLLTLLLLSQKKGGQAAAPQCFDFNNNPIPCL